MGGRNEMDYILIDAPITPYSSKEEIEAWIKELKSMEQTPEVIAAIEDAKELLEGADE